MKYSKILLATKILKENKPIIFPTDTVYGIGVIPTKEGLDRLYSIKKRDKNKKIIALVSDIESIEKIAKNINYQLITKFLPGALSIIFETNDEYKSLLGSTIGVRIPNNKLAQQLIKNAGGILMTSSANISGQEAVKDAKDLSTKLIESVELVFTTDEKLSGVASTVISYIKGEYKLIREGQIKFEDILKEGEKY